MSKLGQGLVAGFFSSGSVSVPRVGSKEFELYIPQALEDDQIVQKLTKLRQQIEQHASEDFYHLSGIETSTEKVTDRVEGGALGCSTEKAKEIASLIRVPESRATGMRVIIAVVLLDSIDLSGDSRHTLLPQDEFVLMNKYKQLEWPQEMEEGKRILLLDLNVCL